MLCKTKFIILQRNARSLYHYQFNLTIMLMSITSMQEIYICQSPWTPGNH